MAHQLSIGGTVRSTRSKIAQQSAALSHAASHAQRTIADMGASTARKIHDSRETAAEVLEVAADSVEDSADRLQKIGHDAAASLSAGARYIRKRKARAILTDVQELVRAHPRKALVGAALFGFLTAKVLRRGRGS
jgi:hypothetical protein